MNDLKFAALIKEGAKTAGLSEEDYSNNIFRLFHNSLNEDE